MCVLALVAVAASGNLFYDAVVVVVPTFWVGIFWGDFLGLVFFFQNGRI